MRLALYIIALLAGPTAVFAAATPRRAPDQDPAAEARHERQWIEVVPAPEPSSLPLLGPDGVDAAGYPKRVVDRAGLRSLLVNHRFARLTEVVETFQAEFEADPRREEWIYDTYDALGYAHPRERELIEAWIAATPRSFAPYLARARYWVRAGLLWRGEAFAHDTSDFEFESMAEAFERARADVRQALALRPALIEARRLLISVEVAGGSRERASRAMQEALAKCPTCYFVRVEWLWALEPRWGGSLPEMEEFATARVDARNPRHRLLRGFIELERARTAREAGNRAQGLAFLDRACAIGDDWRFFIARASAIGSGESYLADVERANAIHPGLSEVLSRRAQVLMQAQRWEEAGRDLLYVLRSNPTSVLGGSLHPALVRGLDSLAWKQHQAGRSAAAARLYELARALAPKDEGISHRSASVGRPAAGARSLAEDISEPSDARPDLKLEVVDGSGRPVPGARIAMRPGHANWEQLDRLASALPDGRQTDEAGHFRAPVSVGPAVVMALLPRETLDAVAVSVAVPTTGAEVRIVAGGANHVEGRVVDRANRPVAGVEVRAIPDTETLGSEARMLGAARSAEDGSFAIEGLDSGRYRIFARGKGQRGPADSPNLGRQVAGGESGIVIPVEMERIFRGRVLVARPGEAPAVAELFKVAAAPFGERSFSSPDGRFSVGFVMAYANTAVTFSVEGRPPVVRALDLLQEDNDAGDVIIGPGRTIRGRVVDPRGLPVARASVAPKAGRPATWTVDDGSFEVVVQDGPVDLVIRHGRWLPTVRSVQGDENEVEVRLSAGARLKLLVVDADGSRLAGATLRALSGGRTVTCTTEANGRCELAGLEPGEYWISPGRTASLDPNRPKPPELYVRVAADEERGVRFRWSLEQTRLAVRVVDQSGLQVQTGARVFPGAPSFAEAMEADGTPRVPYHIVPPNRPLENLPPDRYTVAALGPWGMPACALATLDLRAGDDQAITLRLGDGSCQ